MGDFVFPSRPMYVVYDNGDGPEVGCVYAFSTGESELCPVIEGDLDPIPPGGGVVAGPFFSKKKAQNLAKMFADVNMAKAFLGWLADQTERDDPVGDIARDVAADDRFPVCALNEDVVGRHIGQDDAVAAYRAAVNEWRAYEAAWEPKR